MARFDIYSRDGKDIRYSGCPKYNGTYLKVSFLDFGNVSVPFRITWQIGDYVDYPRTGKRYRLYSLPQVKKQARPGASGESFVYQNVQFHAKTHDLEVAPFRDYVKNDNEIHFSTRGVVNTYENAYGIAERIQSNLDELYPGEWNVRIYNNLDEDFLEKITESQNFSVEGSCLDACNKMYDIWGIGWIHVMEGGKDVLIFGRPNKREVGNTSDKFVYGKGNGLTSIQKSGSMDDVATRLYVYGSTRNMASRYYNGLAIKDAESVDIQHLMIPLMYWGETDGLPDARKAYIEEQPPVEKLGLIPKSVYFEGGDYPEIYPTINGVTIKDVRDVLSPDDQYYPDTDIYEGAERIDKIKDVVNPKDDGGAEFPEFVNSPEVVREKVNTYNYRYYFFKDASVRSPGIYKFRPTQDGYVELEENNYRYSNIFMFAFIRDAEGKIIYNNVYPLPLTGAGTKKTFDTTGFDISVSIAEDFYQEGMTLSCGIQLQHILIASGRVLYVYFHIEKATYLYPSPEGQDERKGDFQLYVRQLGFDINEMTSLSSEGKCTVAMNTGMCAGRQFPVVSARYREETDDWELGMKRQTDESLGEKFPNSNYPIEIDDEFVLLDIVMPDIYISLAEQKLYREGLKLYKETSRVIPYYEPNIDPILMARTGKHLLEGMYMHIYDNDVVDSEDGNDYVLIDTLVISEGEEAIPTYKVTLREQKRKSFQQTTNEAISDLREKTSGISASGKINTEYANRAGSADYASNTERWGGYRVRDMIDQPLRTGDEVSFKGVTTEIVTTDEVVSKNYNNGPLGSGHRLGIDSDGNSTLEVDNIVARKTLTVFEMLIQQLRHQGGMTSYTSASIECTEAETTTDGYKCFFDTKNGSIPNLFVVGDQARCQRFAVGTTEYKYYWRYVSEIGEDYIVLSANDCDTDSGIPEKGDNIIQFGNRTDRKRMAAKLTVVTGDDIPRDEYYEGVNSYNLSGKLVTVVGVKDGKVGVFTENGSFKGNVTIGTGSSGLGNLSEWGAKQQQMDDTKALAENVQSLVNTINDIMLPDLQNQIDGAIESWRGDDVPTLDNYPASEWVDDTERARHVGDYYDRKVDVDGEVGYERYRFDRSEDGRSWGWTLIADSGSAQALAAAIEALGVATGKNKTFYQDSVPLPPYQIDDIWIKTSTGAIYVSCVGRSEGSAIGIDDWVLANNAQARVSDLEYIEQLFPKGNLIAEGAVLGSLLGVMDSEENIVAGINGTELGNDADHGKLLIFAGATGIEDVVNAKFRVYEDGYFSAVSGRIAFFDIEGDELSSHLLGIGTRRENYHFSLTAKGWSLEQEKIYRPSPVISQESNSLVSTDGSSIVLDVTSKNVTSSTNRTSNNHCDLSADSIYFESSTKEGIYSELGLGYLQLTNKSGENAITVHSGTFAGLRPAVKFVTTDQTLSLLDHTILCYKASGALTLTLPDNQVNGQEYVIYKMKNFSLTVKTSNGDIINNILDVKSQASGETSAFAGIVHVVWSDYDVCWWYLRYN